jgi:hypothetical protein
VVRNQPRYLSEAQITSFVMLVDAETEDVVLPEIEVEEPETVEPAEGSGINWLLIGGLCIVVLVAIVAAVYFFVLHGKLPHFERPEILNKRKIPEDDIDFDEDANRYMPPAQVSYEPTYPNQPSALPVAQFMTTYALGDDLYDDSFSIDAPTGEFLGECGVGISETVGVGEPKRVTAFEVWLFDKNDIQTVTKVIMSEHAHRDEKLRMRLESKGELVLAEPGKQILLETATLQLEARIIDMAYGEGPAPDLSFFERVTLELAIWPK